MAAAAATLQGNLRSSPTRSALPLATEGTQERPENDVRDIRKGVSLLIEGTMENNWKPTDEHISCLRHLIDLVEDEWGDVEDTAYELLDELEKMKKL